MTARCSPSCPRRSSRAFLIAAGRAVHPEIEQRRKLVRALRSHERRRAERHDREAVNASAIREAREAPTFVAPPLLDASAPPERSAMRPPRSCYVCKAEYRRVHFFYDSMCPAVRRAQLRQALPDRRLDGRVALITGARVKIGYQAALMLLRAGAPWWCTTRFPHDAARRYAREPDFADWAARLAGPRPRPAPRAERRDLRPPPERSELERLDILINNAARRCAARRASTRTCSTARSARSTALPRRAAPVVRAHHDCVRLLEGARAPAADAAPASASAGLVAWRGGGGRARHAPRRALAAAACGRRAARGGRTSFPDGAARRRSAAGRPPRGEQLAARRSPTCPTAELLEVHLVNAVAPFILCSQLKPLMLRAPDRRQARRQRLGDGGAVLARQEDRQAPAHEHGQGGAQHDDAAPRRATTRATGSS